MSNLPNLSRKERVILSLLACRGEMYGLEMVGASPELKRGTIYVALSRMAAKGYVESRQEKDPGDPGLPRRLFRATEYGLGVLQALELAQNTLSITQQAQTLGEPPPPAAQEAARPASSASTPVLVRRGDGRAAVVPQPVQQGVRTLVDQLERGEMTRLHFIRSAAALGAFAVGLSAFVEPTAAEAPRPEPKVPANDLLRSGFLVRVSQVDPKAGNSIEGIVLPEALPFWHRLSSGTWRHRTVSGRGFIEVDGVRHEVPAGKALTIPANARFTYINPGVEPWVFAANLPFWEPPSFSYGYGDLTYAGDEIWFEIKRAPMERKTRPVYRVIPAARRMNYAVIALGPGESTLGVESPVGNMVLAPITGSVDVALARGQDRQAAKLARGEAHTAAPGEVFTLHNPTATPSLVEMRPDPPRLWHPETTLWELEPGERSTGDLVWFELVIPI